MKSHRPTAAIFEVVVTPRWGITINENRRGTARRAPTHGNGAYFRNSQHGPKATTIDENRS
jgi:hypothetical protein